MGAALWAAAGFAACAGGERVGAAGMATLLFAEAARPAHVLGTAGLAGAAAAAGFGLTT